MDRAAVPSWRVSASCLGFRCLLHPLCLVLPWFKLMLLSLEV
jgi:hypothetical protein